MSKRPITHCEHGIDLAYRCIDCIEADRDALRARAEKLEIEREAQRSCAIYWMDQENALRALMLEALESLVGDKYQAVEHNPEDGARCFYCGGPLKVLWHEDSYLEHEMDCDFVKARAVLARVKGDAE